jgi:pyruvate kinase
VKIVRKTKIVATLGPATNNYKALKSLIQNGANVIRLNFSHGDIEQHQKNIDLIKQVREELNKPVSIMVDTRGPEVRVRTFEDGCGILKKGTKFTLYGFAKQGNNEGVSVSEPKCLKNLSKDDIILANDGLIKLSVIENKGFEVVCKVLSGGILKDNKGLNFKNVPLNLNYIGENDKKDLIWAFKNECDMVSASFVNSVDDIKQIKKLIIENTNIQFLDNLYNRNFSFCKFNVLYSLVSLLIASGKPTVDIDKKKLYIV